MWKWILVLLAVFGTVLATDLAIRSGRPAVSSASAAPPSANPFPDAIAGAGIVEPRSESVMIGPPEPGLVAEVLVAVGDRVAAGAPLYRLDSSSLEGQKSAAEAAVAVARAELERTRAYRRASEEPGLVADVAATRAAVTVAEHALAEATANVGQAQIDVLDAQLASQEEALEAQEKQKDYQRLESIHRTGAGTSQEEVDHAKLAWDVSAAQQEIAEQKIEVSKSQIDAARAREAQARARVEQAQAQLAAFQASLDDFKAGPSATDVAKAQAEVAQAQAEVDRLARDITRRTVTAPIDATVLRLQLRRGQYVAGGDTSPERAPLVLGDVEVLHVRVEVDEFDVPRFDPKKQAVAYLKTQGAKAIALEFVRVDPFVVPKRSLTNSQTELVDARVLEVVYRIGKSDAPLYVGAQMDVFIEE